MSLWRFVVLGILLCSACAVDESQFAWSSAGEDVTQEDIPNPECPLREMVLIPGSSDPFTWGASPMEHRVGDAYNWMLEAEYPNVDPFCMLVAPFPGRQGFPYFETSDLDDSHGLSYGDMESVQASQVLAQMDLRLMDFREAAWFQKSIAGDVDLNFCDTEIRPEGQLAYPECRTSLGVEIGPYAFWTVYDSDGRAAHEASILALTGDSGQEEFVGLPHEALGFLIAGWGGGTVCGSRTPYCVHHHVVEYRALWDGPLSMGMEVDPDDPFQTWPGSYWRDDYVMLVTTPGPPDAELQSLYDELVERYEASNYNKAVLWDPEVGL